MKKLFFIAFAALLFSCISDEEIDVSIPVCVQNILDDPSKSTDLKTIKVQRNDGELHYWLNTDFTHSDGPEFVVNSSCDTVCTLCGECFPPECIFEYNSDDWQIIWER